LDCTVVCWLPQPRLSICPWMLQFWFLLNEDSNR
jgi:hypothetical protein